MFLTYRNKRSDYSALIRNLFQHFKYDSFAYAQICTGFFLDPCTFRCSRFTESGIHEFHQCRSDHFPSEFPFLSSFSNDSLLFRKWQVLRCKIVKSGVMTFMDYIVIIAWKASFVGVIQIPILQKCFPSLCGEMIGYSYRLSSFQPYPQRPYLFL